MRITVFGAGLVGRRAASILSGRGHHVVLVAQARRAPELKQVTTATGWSNAAAEGADVVVLATESAHQFALARELVRNGTSVITTADNPAHVRRLWALHDLARDRGAHLAVGIAYSPGVSTLLASYLAHGFDEISAIRTAQFGTGGPSCAREHHRAMSSSALEVHQGLLRPSRGGSGRELVWFPDPVGPADCYRAALSDPFLLHQAFPGVARIESRQAATRRDRITARLPMLRSPHAEGLLGAVWAEVRGRLDGMVEHRAMAATGSQATGAAAMVAAYCEVVQLPPNRPPLMDDRRNEADRWSEGITPRVELEPGGVQSVVTSRNLVPMLRLVSEDLSLLAYDGSQVVTMGGLSAPVQAARKWSSQNENPWKLNVAGRKRF